MLKPSLGLPDAHIVKQNAGTRDGEVEAGLRFVGDSRGLQIGHGCAIHTDAELVTNEFEAGLVPLLLLQIDLADGPTAFEEFFGVGFAGRVFAHFEDVIAHDTFFVITQTDLFGGKGDAADVTCVGTLELLVVEDCIESGGTHKLEFELHDHVFHGTVNAAYGTMIRACLHAFEFAIFHRESGDDGFPTAKVGALKIIGDELLTFFSQRLGRDVGSSTRERKSEAKEREEFHIGITKRMGVRE